MADQKDDLAPSAEGRRGKLEVRTVLLLVALLIVLGGLYTAFFGSPARNRAAIDSSNTNPFAASRAQNAATGNSQGR